LTISSSGTAQFKNRNCKMECIKIATEKMGIEYDNTLASDYEYCHTAACFEYVNSQSIVKWQLFSDQPE
jgi:hypothetical protein